MSHFICYLPGFCFFQKRQSRLPTTPSPCSCWTNSQSLKSEMVWEKVEYSIMRIIGKHEQTWQITGNQFPKLTKCLTLDWRLLERLSNSQGNLLEDTELIEANQCKDDWSKMCNWWRNPEKIASKNWIHCFHHVTVLLFQELYTRKIWLPDSHNWPQKIATFLGWHRTPLVRLCRCWPIPKQRPKKWRANWEKLMKGQISEPR